MYLFNRTTIATLGKAPDAIAGAIDVAGMVTDITGTEVSVFTYAYGEPEGTVMWSAIVETQSEISDADAKLMADSAYLDKLQSLDGLFARPAEDNLSQVISPPPEATGSKFYGLTRAAMANGKFGPAMEFGVKAADYIGSALGAPSVFVKSVYAGFGDVAWIVGFDTMDDVGKFSDWQLSDSGYHDIVAEAGPLFVENSGTSSLLERLH